MPSSRHKLNNQAAFWFFICSLMSLGLFRLVRQIAWAPLWISLIDTNVVHFEPCRECSVRGIASMLSANGKIEDQKVGLAKRVLFLAVSVASFGDVNRVQQNVVGIKPDAGFVPIHSPHMKLF